MLVGSRQSQLEGQEGISLGLGVLGLPGELEQLLTVGSSALLRVLGCLVPAAGTRDTGDTFALPCATFAPSSTERDGGQHGVRSGHGGQAFPVPRRGHQAHRSGQRSQQSRTEVGALTLPAASRPPAAPHGALRAAASPPGGGPPSWRRPAAIWQRPLEGGGPALPHGRGPLEDLSSSLS